MKKLLTVFAVFIYFVPVSLFLAFSQLLARELQDSSLLGSFAVPIIFMILVCALIVVNIIGAVISAMRSRCLSFRTVMIFKLCLIPFYIVNFVCWMIGSMVFHIAIIIWSMLPFVIAYTYFTMLGTSVHIIAKLFALRKGKAITTKQFVIHFILQIMFAIDMIDSIYLAIKQKKFESALQQT